MGQHSEQHCSHCPQVGSVGTATVGDFACKKLFWGSIGFGASEHLSNFGSVVVRHQLHGTKIGYHNFGA